FRLMFFYPKWNPDPKIWYWWLAVVGVVAVIAALWSLRHRIGRGPLVAVLFFIGTMFPALGFISFFPMRYSLVADHFQYLAEIGIRSRRCSWEKSTSAAATIRARCSTSDRRLRNTTRSTPGRTSCPSRRPIRI